MPTLELPFADVRPDSRLPDGLEWRERAVDLAEQRRLFGALTRVLSAAPPAKNRTTGGGLTSAAMTNCGTFGWWSDAKGYRYVSESPVTGRPWPPFPGEFSELIQMVIPNFRPDACLINHYGAGAKMGLHQDKDERDFAQPIVTVCLGDDADFLVGGFSRNDKARAIVVKSGDVLIMGGASRMRFHGIRKIYPGTSPLPEIAGRYSLTFRKAM